MKREGNFHGVLYLNLQLNQQDFSSVGLFGPRKMPSLRKSSTVPPGILRSLSSLVDSLMGSKVRAFSKTLPTLRICKVSLQGGSGDVWQSSRLQERSSHKENTGGIHSCVQLLVDQKEGP
ncbi:hypothetical protein E2320_014364 [Naja naja]|nr:hypothetical protein E2320_014364 [Naja naja]